MTESTLHDACNLTWTTEKQMVPVLEKCLEMAGRHDCLEEVDQVVSIHRHVLHDCTELMAAMGVDSTIAVVDITIPDDFVTCIVVVHGHFMRVIDNGYIIIDPHASHPAQRAVLERVTRRKAEQIRLLRKIAEKCQISLPGEAVSPPSMPPEKPPALPPAERTEYVVQAGDTMFGIARRFGVPLEVLIRANPQVRNPDVIIVGEIIIVPKGKPPAPTPGPAPSPGRRYVVRSGDTMFLIAQTFAVSLAELVAFNPQIADPNVLVPGEVVLIPTSGGALG
ncbi:MAG TPA: LysM peptidoglycan-binding domain-containing protein [Firmicutes bacterium]|nr:LysM peptidoglycan-binding domain-containing protein [Candidatus Fermentithermobacillaceae bacterium]